MSTPSPGPFAIPHILLRIPTAEEGARAKAFTVHKNYLSAISAFILDQYGPPDTYGATLLAAQQALPGYSKIQARKPPAPDEITRYLTISFASELQLRLSGSSNPAVVRYANVWAPVHAYYAVYMSLQALFAMNGMSEMAPDHTSTLRTVANMISTRQLFPLPWRVSCSGCPQLNEVEFSSAPPGVEFAEHVEVLARPTSDTFWPRYGKMLTTTRKRRLERNFGEWKKSRGRKAMFAHEKKEVAAKLAPTTIFDFFWRIRVRANYRDVSSFLTWNVDDLEHLAYYESLLTLVDATTMLLQSLLVRTGGRALFASLTSQFLQEHQTNTGTSLEFLERRAELLLPSAKAPFSTRP